MNFRQEEIDKKVRDFLAVMRTPGYCANRGNDMLNALTPEVIRELAAHPKKWASLGKVAAQLSGVNEIEFYERVGRLHAELPQREVLEMACHRMFRPSSRQWLTIRDKKEVTRYAESPFLIDLNCIQEIICQQKGKGWQFLRYCGEYGRRSRELNLPEALTRAIDDDAPEIFAITMDITGTRLSYSLLVQILKYGKFRIFRDLVQRQAIPDEVITPAELCVLCVTNGESGKAVERLKILEECLPGIVREFRDPFGRNLLWYAIRNCCCIWFHPEDQLVSYLLAQGCDADNCNTLGLSWRFAVENMSQKTQKGLWLGYGSIIRGQYPAAQLRYEPPKGRGAAVRIISRWEGTAVPGKNMGLEQVLRLNGKANLKKSLTDRFLEAYFSYRYFPEATLPRAWQAQLADAGTFHALETPLVEADLRAMNLYHHPLAAYPPGGSWGTRLATIPMKQKKSAPKWKSEQEHALAILQTGLLVYHPLVKAYYCRNRYPGWEILRHHGGLAPAEETYPQQEQFLPLIEQDRVPDFALLYGMRSGDDPCPPAMLNDLMRCGACHILQWLKSERDEFNEQYSREELFFSAVSVCSDNVAVKVLTSLDDGYGLCRVKDGFGSTLLWYALFNPQIPKSENESALLRMLRKKGCCLFNKFGISPQDLLDVATNREVIAVEKGKKHGI